MCEDIFVSFVKIVHIFMKSGMAVSPRPIYPVLGMHIMHSCTLQNSKKTFINIYQCRAPDAAAWKLTFKISEAA